MKPATARSLALEILSANQSSAKFTSELIDDRLRHHSLIDVERRLLRQLVLGVIRRQRTLKTMIQPFLQRTSARIDPEIWNVLMLGAYQIALLDQIPTHAAVSESVTLAKSVKPRAAGFVNGVLRRIGELVSDQECHAPAADALPLEQGGRYRRLNRAIFPDPEQSPADYLGKSFSFPDWMTRRWLARYGFAESLRLGFWFNAPPPIWLRVNSLHATRDELLNRFRSSGIACEPGSHPRSIRLVDRRAIRKLPGYEEGDFTVQDISAMSVAPALKPTPGMHILDLCAAPGGKTTHLAELMNNQGQIIACDIRADRLKILMNLCQRLKISIVEPCVIDPEDESTLPRGPFDAILVDVPCSNTGVLGRRAEVRNRLREAELAELCSLQQNLLRQAADRLKPGGAMVYSTCSIEPTENQEVIQAFLAEHSDWTLEEDQESQPGRPGDGGYWARLRRG